MRYVCKGCGDPCELNVAGSNCKPQMCPYGDSYSNVDCVEWISEESANSKIESLEARIRKLEAIGAKMSESTVEILCRECGSHMVTIPVADGEVKIHLEPCVLCTKEANLEGYREAIRTASNLIQSCEPGGNNG